MGNFLIIFLSDFHKLKDINKQCVISQGYPHMFSYVVWDRVSYVVSPECNCNTSQKGHSEVCFVQLNVAFGFDIAILCSVI